MSLVTTCPDCATAFKVKPEQLTVRRGDVCCGKCGFIFNALDHLAETPAQDEQQQTASALITNALPESVSDMTVTEPVSINNIHDEEDITLEDEVSFAEMPQEAVPGQPAAVIADLESAAHLEPDAFLPDAASVAADQSAEPVPTPSSEPRPSIDALTEPESPIKFELLEPKPKRRFSSTLLGMLAALLLFVGFGQSAYFLRTQLAAQYTPAKPLLVQFCNLLGCTVDLPQQADLLAIDESDLQQDAEHENVVLLSSTLINHAHYAQAYPMLEVTLTDTNDHAVLRRIFRPTEYLPKNTDLQAGMPPDAYNRIKLHLTTGDVRPTGYRVYVSYFQ